jgi:hypothetical protein
VGSFPFSSFGSYYEQVRASGADGFTEVPFCSERPALDRCLRQTD